MIKVVKKWMATVCFTLTFSVSEVLASSCSGGCCGLPTLFKYVLPQHACSSHTSPHYHETQSVIMQEFFFFLMVSMLSPPFWGARSFHTVSKQVRSEITPAFGFDGFLNFTCLLSKGRTRKSGDREGVSVKLSLNICLQGISLLGHKSYCGRQG